MPGLGALWDSLVDCICRPPRDEYIYPDELVGGSRRLFRVGRYPGIREDLTLTNKRGLTLQCSHYLPKHVRGKDGRLPCVIYCHCNSGSRRDAEEAICVLIPCGVSVFTLDFAGSGLSEGQWVTLGAEEVDDVATAVEHLRSGGKVSTLGLWGRSMGAVTALLYSQRDPSIAGMVLDSPFSRLTDLMLEIVQEQRLPIPRPLAKLALAAMRRSVMKRAGFDITKVSPVEAVSQSYIPALFGHATGDTFIRISHAETLHDAYAGDKNLIRFEGDHNSRRPEFFYNSVSIFWHNTLHLEHMLEPADLSLASLGPSSLTGSSGSSRPGASRPLRPPPARLRQPNPSPALINSANGAGPAVPGAPAEAGAAAVAGGATGASANGEEEEDIAAGISHRSAPWEPRLWEMDADRAARERQRFRRMAGGLPSPAPTTDEPGGGRGAADAGIGGGGGFRSSAELAKLFATNNDESLAARLLGEDPQLVEGPPAPDALTGQAVGGAPAATPPNGRLVNSLMAASLLLPQTEEEEEAHLRAALELSLLEAAGKQAPGAAAGGAAGSSQQLQPPLAQSTTTASTLVAESSVATSSTAGGSGGSSAAAPRTVAAMSSSLIFPGTVLMGAAASAAGGASAVPVAGVEPAATGAEGALRSLRSNSHEDGRTQPPMTMMPAGAISGPPHPGQPADAGSASGSAALLAVATSTDAAMAAVDATTALAVSDAPPAAVGSAAAPRLPPVPLAGGTGMPAAAAATAALSMAEAAGLTVYDFYSEEELLSMAVQMSLQDSAASMGAAAPQPAAPPSPLLSGDFVSSNAGTGAGEGGGGAAAPAGELPSLL